MSSIFRPLPSGARCGSCRYFEPNEVGGDEGRCRESPPVLHFIPVPVQTIQGSGIQIQNIAGWPPVRSNQWCGRFVSSEPQFLPRGDAQ